VWQRVDLVLRFLYLILAPFFLSVMTGVFPMTGILIGCGLATGIALFGSKRWVALVGRLPIVGRILANMGRLGDYYEERAPRALVYYILYPLLAPYWLVNRDARREFLVYRRLNSVAVAIVLALATIDYLRVWRPIPFHVFFGASVAMFVFQLLVLFALVMPIVTTIVICHRRGLEKSLYGALALVAVTGTLGVWALHQRPHVSASANARVEARTKLNEQAAFATMMDAAEAVLRAPDQETALAAARATLRRYYRADEAAAFRVYRDATTIAVYALLPTTSRRSGSRATSTGSSPIRRDCRSAPARSCASDPRAGRSTS
jgi:hypothetical protein